MAVIARSGPAFTLMVNSDPTLGGIAAPIGWTAKHTITGQIWQKTGALDTNWTLLSSGSGTGATAYGSINTYGGGVGFTLASLTSVGLLATATTSVTNIRRLMTGHQVVMSGALQPAYNGTFTITKATASTFTYTMLSLPGVSPATGTPAFNPLMVQGGNFTGASKTGTGDFIVSFTGSGSVNYSCVMPASIDANNQMAATFVRESLVSSKNTNAVFLNTRLTGAGTAVDCAIIDITITG